MKIIDYFYDGQIRRYLEQIVRAFSGIQYETIGPNGKELLVVPCTMASQNRQVASIIRNNSENSINTVPYITIFVAGVDVDRSRTQAPGFVSSVHPTERAKDEDGNYTGDSGTRYTIDRMIPHPLNINIQVDIWTSNEHQKHQLFEQIFMAFNVGFAIQNSDNAMDWSSLTDMELIDINWSSRTVPTGTTDTIDIMSLTFMLPTWINPPAKVKAQKLIHQINTNIIDSDMSLADADYPYGPRWNQGSEGDLLTQIVTTPDNAAIEVDGNYIKLLHRGGLEEENGVKLNWEGFLEQYGKVTPTKSQLMLKWDLEGIDSNVVVGTIQFTSEPNVLHWQPIAETLPESTLPDVKGIIDPLKSNPLTIPTHIEEGVRFIVTNDIGDSVAWGVRGYVLARRNDIIELRNGEWINIFDSNSNTTEQYTKNITSGKQLKFTDGEWTQAIDGTYSAGYWRLKL